MKSEQVAGFILECMAGFVGIRMLAEDMADAGDLIAYCEGAILGGMDWPDHAAVERLRGLSQGYGCWLGWFEEAMEKAELPASRWVLWRCALNGAQALIWEFHKPEWQRH